MTYDWGKARHTVFSNNAFFGRHSEIPSDPNAVTGDPRLVGPLTDLSDLESVDRLKLQVGSPCIGRGRDVGDAVRVDFWGGRLPHSGSPRCIGAHEFGKD